MATAASMRPPPPEGGPGDRAPSPSPPATLAYCHPDPRWLHALHDALAGRRGQSVARRLVGRCAHDLPAGYAQTTTAATAALDLIELDRVTRSDSAIVMTMRAHVDAKLLRFVLYKRGPRVTLSEFLPMLESLGLTVVEEVVYRFEGSHSTQPLHLHDFGVHTGATPIDVGRDGPRLTNAVEAIWAGRAVADALNRLILAAHLAWDDVAILRAYRRYRQQVDATFSAPYLDAALTDQPVVARALIDLFTARLDPERGDEAAVAVARQRVIEGCDAVERLDTDRILRGYLALVEATVRTNRWVVDDAGAPREHLALKLDSQAVPGIPRPVPFREVFVCAADMEGVHLRDGPVARGGIRWSDRPEDYRTEILGLMKAQSVKNAVIVPTGAKGGFVLTQQPADPKERRAAVQRAYITFIRGLLDVTDNVVDGEVVPPSQVRRADGDDPYLVVAADRGTATFSDLANTISAEYGFWLGDGFASGGSCGYDHKAMGITARGAWVAVQRHFRELDVDVQAQTITVVGIGDMSGDVFGNGLLRSRAAKLVAAFDHRHIFIDPDPDPTASFAERQRLYDLPHSSWDDYDRGLISAGGGVWPRAAKRVPLSAPVRALLGVQATALSPPELIRALLRAPADLLYAGGIGTFIKASSETDADVGDRANDAIRINADEVGARVIAEGGNLAVTQPGRVEYARRGGRSNIDAVDNAAGVDTSDHEVNLKILLALAQADGLLTAAQRDTMLQEATQDVAGDVLRNVSLQTGVLSREAAASAERMQDYEALMAELEQGPGPTFDRDVEALPTTPQMQERIEAGAGLTRPELAVLLSQTKVAMSTGLIAADLPDSATWRAVLCGYYPPRIAERFCDLLHDPRLRAELVATLVATVVANDVVNRMGITYVQRVANELGASWVQVVRAYWVAREVAEADTLWRAIESLDSAVQPALCDELHAQVGKLVDTFTRSYLPEDLDDLDAVIARDRRAVAELPPLMAAVGSDHPRTRRRRDRTDRYRRAGVDDDLAMRVATLDALMFAPDIAAVARTTGEPLAQVALVFTLLAEALQLDRLTDAVARLDTADTWQRWQQQGLVDDLRAVRRRAARAAMTAGSTLAPAEAVEALLVRRHATRQRARTVMGLLDREPKPSIAAAAVAVRALGQIVDEHESPAHRPAPRPVVSARLQAATATGGRR